MPPYSSGTAGRTAPSRHPRTTSYGKVFVASWCAATGATTSRAKASTGLAQRLLLLGEPGVEHGSSMDAVWRPSSHVPLGLQDDRTGRRMSLLRALVDASTRCSASWSKFGTVGFISLGVTSSFYNLVLTSSTRNRPLTARVIATVVAARPTAFFLNRHWSFKHRQARARRARRDALHRHQRRRAWGSGCSPWRSRTTCSASTMQARRQHRRQRRRPRARDACSASGPTASFVWVGSRPRSRTAGHRRPTRRCRGRARGPARRDPAPARRRAARP
jgi:hypothetical protein